MIELIVKRNGIGPYKKKELDELGNSGSMVRRAYFKGDIIKCVPKNWHKYYDIPSDWMVIRVRCMKWKHDRHVLTEPLWEGSKVVSRRRNYIDVDKLPNKSIVTVWKLRNIIKDKEEKE